MHHPMALPCRSMSRKHRPICASRISSHCQERHWAASFDYLVGGVQEFVRYAEAERLGGLEVDCELERGRLLDWQLGWIGLVENFVDVDAQSPVSRRDTRAVRHKTAGLDDLLLRNKVGRHAVSAN